MKTASPIRNNSKDEIASEYPDLWQVKKRVAVVN